MTDALAWPGLPGVDGPGSDGRVVQGGGGLFGALPAMRRDPLGFFLSTAEAVAPYPAALRFAHRKILLLTDPTDMRRVMHDNARNYVRSGYYGELGHLFGESIFTTDGEAWQRHRSAAQPAFGACGLRNALHGIAGAVDDLVFEWQQALEGSTGRHHAFDPGESLSRFTLDGLLRAFFSARLQDSGLYGFHGALGTVLRVMERRIWAAFALPPWVPTAENRTYRDHIQTVRASVEGLIDRRLATDRSDAEGADLLDLILAKASGRKDACNQVLAQVVAGHETTSNTLAFALHELSRNPDLQARIAKEGRDVLAAGPHAPIRVPDLESVRDLAWSRAVWDETLRLFPPIWTMSRQAVAADRLSATAISAGETVMVSPWIAHRLARNWPNPTRFEPTRFLGDRAPGRLDFRYFPFGGGHRTCQGSRFAGLEGPIALAALMANFEVFPVADQPSPAPLITLRLPEGTQIGLARR